MQGFDIALPGDEGFQRYIARRVVLERELRVTTGSGDSFRGFVIGLDTEWLQMTVSPDWDPVLVRITGIIAVSETGRRMSELGERESSVRGYAHAVTVRAEQTLAAHNRSPRV